MLKYMRDDGLGEWNVDQIDGSHVEWRRREARAVDASFGTAYVVDISVDGHAPTTFPDFDDKVPFDQQLEFCVRQMKVG